MSVIVLVGVENSNDKLGCRKSPKKIIDKFPENYFSESKIEINKKNLIIEEINLENINFYETSEKIYKTSKLLFNDYWGLKRVIFLGGDHSLTYYTAKAFYEKSNENMEESCLIIFDAHADCKIDNYYSNNENDNDNDSQLSNNTRWLKKIIDSGFPSERIILIGLRELTKLENEYLINNKIQLYRMKDIFDINEICDIVMELSNKYNIYISIDIDVVDSAFVPGTSRSESGGMTSRELIYFIQRLKMLKNVRAIDLVEINTDLDFKDVTLNLGVKILGEVI